MTNSNYGYKECPICKAKVFADMDTCFGCMYRFEDNVGVLGSITAKETREEPSWLAKIEIRENGSMNRSWTFELFPPESDGSMSSPVARQSVRDENGSLHDLIIE